MSILFSFVPNLKINKMKKIIAISIIAISFFACDKSVEAKAVKEIKTAYVDTSLLMKEYEKTKDIEAKFKVKAETKGSQLEAQINLFKKEASNFQAQAKGRSEISTGEPGGTSSLCAE